jgi:hypothetical protein
MVGWCSRFLCWFRILRAISLNVPSVILLPTADLPLVGLDCSCSTSRSSTHWSPRNAPRLAMMLHSVKRILHLLFRQVKELSTSSILLTCPHVPVFLKFCGSLTRHGGHNFDWNRVPSVQGGPSFLDRLQSTFDVADLSRRQEFGQLRATAT